MKAKKFVYELLPIDFWDGWIPLSLAMEDPAKYGIISDYSGEYGSWSKPDRISKFQEHLRRQVDEAKYLITKHTSWEGDGHIYITSMPGFDDGGGESHLVFAIKQGNNGTTFIVSPFEYVHLRESLTAQVTVDVYTPTTVSTANDSDELPF